ncbi:tandem-95 repeat protein [Sulfitobacter sp. S223]|uniref:Ig-like domain-containing protein n=1 Tax=Sulfitobacter sp. S223 TaxID=2867023 RepID=UPI0021A6DF87|nr:tandem-95 repeat protein [Sulfitobacter sp. S223]UWR25066.1 tandem-95 repeat protein [Sulfitobacter sp. S223]
MAINFNQVGSFQGISDGPNVISNPTSLQFGPDGRLYVAEQNGTVNAFTVTIEDGQYVATDHEALTLASGLGVVTGLQNHNDDGSLSGEANRQVTGIVVAGTAENPVLYISSSDPRISSNGEVNLDTNSGIVTQVSWTGTEWVQLDLIRGLPRSEENHATNGMVLSPDGETLYLAVGGNTNNGAPSSFFSYTGEYALSGSVLEIDLVDLASRPVLQDADGGQGGTVRDYVYDLPTLDDPSVANDGVREDANGMDVNGPFGGNDGLNMAVLPADAPLRIFADGFRNPYDLVMSPSGQLYTVDNGSNGNLGGDPVVVDGEASQQPNNGGTGAAEPLFLIEDGGYYGHPNPARSNQNLSWTVYDDNGNPDGSVTPNTVSDLSALVPDGVQIADGFLIDPSKFTGDPVRLAESGVRVPHSSVESNSLVTVGSSSNGLVYYNSNGTAFDGALDGSLLVTQFNDNLTVLNLNDAGTAVEALVDPGPDGILGTADDFVPTGAGDGTYQLPGFAGNLINPLDVTVAPDGSIWIAEIGSNDISVWVPSDVVLPNDNDFDNDGLLNAVDPFTRDDTNGTSVLIEGNQTYTWSFAASGVGDDFPGPDGYGGGLTGVMVNGTTDFEAFFQEPSSAPDQDVNLDNVKFNTAAGGGATVIETVSNGDPFTGSNSGEFLFHTGVVLSDAVDTLNIRWSFFNPGDAFTGTYQQIGGYIGTGDQSNYLKVVAIQHPNGEIQVTLEDGDAVAADQFIQADGIFDVTEAEAKKIFAELDIDIVAETATATITYETATGTSVVVGTPISLSGTAVLDAIKGDSSVQGQQTGLAVGLFATNNGEAEADAFQAVFDDIQISATETPTAPMAEDDLISTGLDEAITVSTSQLLVNDTDANADDTLTITAVGDAVNGTVLLNNNGTAGDPSDDSITFSPTAGFQGEGSFSYTVTDSDGLTATASVTVGIDNETVLYRVNAGGAEIASLDDGPNWSADTDTANSAFLIDAGENNLNGFNVAPGASVGPEVPAAIFQTERWDQAGGTEMQWGFDVGVGVYEVRLYMGNGYTGTGTPGTRVFDVAIEGAVLPNLDDIDLSAGFGNLVGGVISNEVTVTDGQLNIEFLHGVENPLINGIEIIKLAGADVDPTVSIISGDQVVTEDIGQVQISLATDITVPAAETVDITFEIVPGGATPLEDYSYSDASASYDTVTGIYTDTVSIAGSSSDVTFLVNILQDALPEANEAFSINILSVGPNANIGVATASVTIEDDDTVTEPGQVLFRINSGGAEVAATDGGPNWSEDSGVNPTPFLVAGGGNTFASTATITVDPADVNGAPSAIFDTERWDPVSATDDAEMQYEFGGLVAGDYTVNLYLAEGSATQSAPGERSFDVAVEGVVPTIFSAISPFDTNGNAAFVLSYTTAITDGVLDLDFLHGAVNNPAVRGIEILAAGAADPADTVNGLAVSGGDFSSDADAPDAILLPAGGSTTIVSNLEGSNADRDFITVEIPDGYRLADVLLDNYVADPGNSGFLGLKLGDDLTLDPAVPQLGQSPDGVVEPGDLNGGLVFNEGFVGNDLLSALNDTSSGFAGFDIDALTGNVTFWLNQGGDASHTTLTFVTEAIPATGGQIVAAINAGGPALTQDGIDFSADTAFLNGLVYVDGNGGNGPQTVFDGTIYETERYGGAPTDPALDYVIPVAAGAYSLELHFAEIFQPINAIGGRVFDVFVEGQLVIDDLDILEQTGGDINQPFVLTLPETFSPDVYGDPDAIDISFSASVDNAKISGIVVREAEVEPEPTGGSAILTINDGQDNIETSNFGNGSFQITNNGNKNISFIEIDVSDAVLVDAVFDPFGIAGDSTAKILTLNNGTDGGTGLVVPTDTNGGGGFDEDAIGIVYLGSGGADGYERIRLEFTDFNPGETLTFGLDMDPNSIAGSSKSTLDSGAPLQNAGGNNIWDVGGIGGAELAGSLFTVGYSDGTGSTGQLQGQGTGEQIGALALSTQDSDNLEVNISVSGIAAGDEGTYGDGGPQILISGPAGETARVMVLKGMIVPFTNEFTDTNGAAFDPVNVYHDRLDQQLQALEDSGFPANNAVEILYVDVPLDGSVQDISSLFDFTQVANFDLSVPDQVNEFGELNEAHLPLGIVASVIDVVTDASKGPVTSPIHLTYAENAAPVINPIADIEIGEGAEAAFSIQATDADGDAIALSVAVSNDAEGTFVDPAQYSFADNGDGTGSFAWTTAEPDDGAYTITVTADDGTSTTTETLALIVNEKAGPQPGDVLYRVNAGGAEVAASDGGPNWSEDLQDSNSPYLVNPGSNNDFPGSGTPVSGVDISLLSGTGAVAEMMGVERWDSINDANGEMAWAFDVAAGTEVEVRIYVAELYAGLPDLDGSGDATGDRVFDISVDGVVPAAFAGIDPYALAGNAFSTGAVVSHTMVSDGTIDLEFLHLSENPAIKGIEIIVAGDTDTAAPTADLTAPDVTTTGDSYTFTIAYSDATAVDVSTLDSLDVTVSNGALAFSTTATLLSVDVPSDGATRIATYQITPPGGSFDPADNGTYTITLNDGEVADILGNVTSETVLGTFDVNVQPTDQVEGGSLGILVTPGTDLDASTYAAGSFQLTNNSAAGVQIAQVSFDLSTGILPDMVFDPTGSGGDATASPFTPNAGAAATGLVMPADPASDPFSQPRNGGFDVLTIDFTNFDPGETFTFTTDIDPNSIQGVPGAGNAGSVSGYELIGSTVTVTFTDGTNTEVSLGSLLDESVFDLPGGSLGGSQGVVTTEAVIAAPTLSVVGAGPDQVASLAGTQVDITSSDFTVEVTGPAGATVQILQMDTRLFIASGAPAFGIAADELAFYANEAMGGKALASVTLDANGVGLADLSLLDTDGGATPDGGLNALVAVVTTGDGQVGLSSTPLVVKTAAPLIFDAPGAVTFDGIAGDVIELPHDEAYEISQGTIAFSFIADTTSGPQGLFSKDASGYVGGGNHAVIYLDGNTLTARFQNGASETILTSSGIAVGQEYEIAATFGASGVTLWVNGNAVASDPLVTDWGLNVEAIQWGGRGWASASGDFGFDAPFNGILADRQIYAQELTASQIAALAATSTASNSPPTAQPDAVSVDEDQAVVFNPADNDVDPDGDPVTVVSVVTDPSNGSAVLGLGGDVTYTPDADFNGTDSFDVQVADGIGGFAVSTVTVTVNAVNDDPTANDDVASTVIDTAAVIDVISNDVDPDGDALTVVAVSDGLLGSVVANGDGTVTYTPNIGVTGEDSFTYTVEDGNGGTADTATVTVSILEAPNQQPVAVDDIVATDEDTSIIFNPADNDTDGNGDTVVVAAILTDPTNGAAVLNTDGTVTYTPDADFNGTDTFEVSVVDGNGGSDSGLVTVNVAPVNDGPVASDDIASVSQDTAVIIDVLSNDVDVDDDSLSISDVSQGAHGSVEVNANGTVTYTPTTAGFSGIDSFTYEVSDGALTDTATVEIEVTSIPIPIVDVPGTSVFNGANNSVQEIAHSGLYSIAEGTLNFSFTAADTIGQQGLFSKDASGYVGGGNHFALYLQGSTLTARFQNGTADAIFTVPNIQAGVTYDVAASFGAGGSTLYLDGVAVGSNPLVMDWTQNVEYIQWGGLGWASASGAAGFVSPFAGTITDKQLYDVSLTPDQIATLHADGPPNADPVAVDDVIFLDEDTMITFDPTANDSDLDGDSLTVAEVLSEPTNGTVVLNGDGTVSYTPDADFFGTDSFDFVIADGRGGTDVSNVSVSVNGVEDNPVANDDFANVLQGEAVLIDLLANDTDADGDALSILSIVDPANGSIVNNGDGTVSYTASDPDFVGTVTFEYVLSDGDGPTDMATVSIGVTTEPVLPTAVLEQLGIRSYDGSAAQVQNIAPSETFEFREGTIAFSFIDDNPGVRQGLVVKDASGFVGGGNHFAAYIENSDLIVRFQDGANSSTQVFENLNAGQEYEVAAVFADEGVQLWVDGVLRGEQSGLVSSWETNQEFLQVGGLGWASATGNGSFTNPFSGEIADLQIFDAALEEALIVGLAEDSSFDLL